MLSRFGLAALVSGALSFVVAGGAVAATVTYYYASGPAFVSNAPKHDRPLLNYGSIVLDPSRAPGGSLANLEVVFRDETPWNPAVDRNADVVRAVDFRFGAEDLATYSLRFDAKGHLQSWHFGSQYYWSTWDFREWSVASGADQFAFSAVPRDTMHTQRIAEWTLAGLGYTESSPGYSDLLCGSWAGDTCSDAIYFASPYWNVEFEARESGQWFTDPLAFAQQVERNTRLALANPPRSFYDIAPIPLPAPAGMLLAGIAALVWARRRSA